MSLIRNTQKTIPNFKTFLPKQPLQHFHTLMPKTNPLCGTPVALLPLHQRTAAPTTRAYSTTSDSNKGPFFSAMVGQTVAFATKKRQGNIT